MREKKQKKKRKSRKSPEKKKVSREERLVSLSLRERGTVGCETALTDT